MYPITPGSASPAPAIRFTARDLAEFSRRSRDVNPLHMDADYARRTPYGRQVVFGVLGGLAGLARLAESGQAPDPSAAAWGRIELEFLNPMFMDVEYALVIRAEGESRCAEIRDGRRVLCRVRAWSHGREGISAAPPPAPAGRPGFLPLEAPHVRIAADVIPGTTWTGAYSAGSAETAASGWECVADRYSEPLMLCSYLVGMEAPGRNALFSRLNLRFPESAAATGPCIYTAESRHFDAGYGLLDLAVAIGRSDSLAAYGEIKAFLRRDLAPESGVPAALYPAALAGKAAIVIGGSRGLGAALARGLAANGCDVALCYRGGRAEAEAVRETLAGAPGKVLLLRGDAADPAFCAQIRSQTLEAFGRIDILICNACTPPQPLEIGEAGRERILEYVGGNLALTLAPLASLLDPLERFRGTLAVISSAFVEGGPKEFPHYISLKHAVEGLARTAVLSHRGVGCLIARPPRLLTDMNNTPSGALGAMPPERAADAILAALAAAPKAGETRVLSDFPATAAASAPSAPAAAAIAGPRLLVAATFTADPILPGLSFWAREMGWDFVPALAPYNQVFQQLLDPASDLAGNRSGLNLILLRVADWRRQGSDPAAAAAGDANHLEATGEEFLAALRGFCGRGARVLTILCPADAARLAPGEAETLARVESAVADGIAKIPGAGILRAADWHARYEATSPFDPERDALGHIPYRPGYYAVLAALAARRWYAGTAAPYKVIAVDCDQTLWEGICEEAGPEGVGVGGRFRAFQEFLVARQAEGFLICLCSKNRPEAVWDVFARRPEMPLGRSHIVDSRINWEPKSENLASLAASLNLGLDAFIFIDDNPVELAEVSARCPQVLCVQAPHDEAGMRALLGHAWFLDKGDITGEDRARTRMYRENAERENLRARAGGFAEFVRGLGLQVAIEPLAAADTPRFSQLTLKTNQFNSTTLRRHESEIRALAAAGAQCLSVKVSDRFGDYGLVGALIAVPSQGELTLDTLLLSCRVLGRGVEHRLLAQAGTLARQAGLARVAIPFSPTPKNEPARKFLDTLEGEWTVAAPDGSAVLRVEAARLEALEFRPGETAETAAAGGNGEDAASPGTRAAGPRLSGEAWERIRGSLGTEAGLARALGIAQGAAVGAAVAPADAQGPAGVLAAVMRAFAGPLSVPVESLDPDGGLDALLSESFQIVEITVELGKAFADVPQTLLFEKRSPREIAAYFSARGTGPAQASAPIGAASEAGDPAAPHADTLLEETESPYFPAAVEPVGPSEPIAIIGMSARLPGAETPEAFWENLKAGLSGVGEIPADRWDVAAYHDPDGADPAKSHSDRGAFLSGVRRFDAAFFGISPKEAMYMDPQQRLFLEAAWGAIEDGGYTRATLDRGTGVFAGVLSGDYALHAAEAALRGASAYRWTDYYQIANRVSYHLDLHGPSLAVDTACSSSATAIHLACESIRKGDCVMALAGGVNLILHPGRFVQYSQMQMIARDGVCRPFGEGALGTIFGEGVGAFLLKPLRAAKRDGDVIHAVILGSAVNASGKTNGFTVPNPEAHAALVRKALTAAGVEAASLGYIEAHGTGTPLGDPIEIRGLSLAFAEDAAFREEAILPGTCPIGSVKGNIGHLESCAAVAGIVKIILQMRHRTLAPSLHAERTNPLIPFGTTPFRVQTRAEAWTRLVAMDESAGHREIPRRAGISSFGAGGSNAHIVLEEAPARLRDPARPSRPGRQLLPLSARTPSALRVQAQRLLARLAAADDPLDLADAAYTLQVGREGFPVRLAVVCDSLESLASALERFLASGAGDGIWISEAAAGAAAAFDLEEAGSRFAAGRPESLAAAWAAGARVDWIALRAGEARLKVSLPGYPFAGEEHWLPAAEARKPAADAPRQAIPTRAGFLGERIDSPFFEGTLLRSRIGLGWQPYLDDHRIYGEVVVPGSFYVSYALAAAAEAAGGSPVRLRNATFVKAIVLGPTDDLEAQFLAKEGSAILATRDAQGRWQTRFTAETPAAGTGPGVPSVLRVDLEELRRRCGRTLDRDAFYRDSRALGFAWGPAFQCIRSLFLGEEEALAEVVLPAGLRDGLEGMSFHPAFLDACYQVFVAALGPETPKGEAFLPLGIDEIVLYGKPPLELWSHARATRAAGPDTMVFDIRLCGGDGEVHAEFLGLRVLRARPAALARAGEALRADWLYRPGWEALPLAEELKGAGAPTGGWLVLAEEEASGRELALRLSAAGAEAGCRTPLASQDGFTEAEIAAAFRDGAANLVYLAAPAQAADDAEAFPEAVMRSGRTLLALAAGAARSEGSRGHQLRFVTCGAHAVAGDAGPIAWTGAAWGLGRVAGWEHPEIWKGAIDLPALPASGHWDMLVQELLSGASEDQVALRERRSVARLAKIPRAEAEASPMPVDAEGSYLITGAFGGLGPHLAGWLVAKGARSLVLAGRRAPGPEAAGAIAGWRELGVAVHIRALDVSDSGQVRALLAESGRAWPALRGIVHAAGVLDDGMLLNLGWERFARVASAKAVGAWNLHRASLGMGLDFFLLFSSASSILGAPGQGNYAFANAFLESLAEHRKSQGLPGLAVAWGPWEGAGMAARTRAKTSGAGWTTEAFGSIRPGEGLRILDAIATGAGTLAVLPYRWEEMGGALNGAEPPSILRALPGLRPIRTGGEVADSPAKAWHGMARAERRAALAAYLGALAARLLGYPEGTVLAADTPFLELGFDSLMAVDLRNRIAKALGTPLPATLAFDHPSLRKLGDHLAAEVLEWDAHPVAHPAVAAPRREPGPAEEVPEAGLEAELDAELEAELNRVKEWI